MMFTKIVKTDLDYLCRELSDGGAGIVVALTIFLRQLMFRFSLGGPIQL